MKGCSLAGTDNADDDLQATSVSSVGRGLDSLARLLGLDQTDHDADADMVVPPISESALVSPESCHWLCHMHLQMWSCCTELSFRPHTYLSWFTAFLMVLHHLHIGLWNVC